MAIHFMKLFWSSLEGWWFDISVDIFIAATGTFSGLMMGIWTNMEQQRVETTP